MRTAAETFPTSPYCLLHALTHPLLWCVFSYIWNNICPFSTFSPLANPPELISPRETGWPLTFMTLGNCGRSVRDRGIFSIAFYISLKSKWLCRQETKCSFINSNPFLIGESLVHTSVYKAGLYEIIFQRCAFLGFLMRSKCSINFFLTWAFNHTWKK